MIGTAPVMRVADAMPARMRLIRQNFCSCAAAMSISAERNSGVSKVTGFRGMPHRNFRGSNL